MVIYLIIIVLFIIIILTGVFTAILKRKKQKSRGKTPYINALNMLLEGKKDEALEYLKKTVKEDTENIMAYIRLGDIFREKGFPIRAAKIHRNLLVRGDITESETNTILHHLVFDYRASGMLNKAIEMAERLIQKNKKNVDNQKLLLSLYEEKGDWDKAFFYRQSINKWLKKRDQDILALYKVQSGLSFVERGLEHEARLRFREALKLTKTCIPAYLYWGDSYRREGRNEDAYRVWREFTAKNPEWAHLAFKRLRDVLFDLGRYSEIEDIYKEVISKNPKDPASYLSLAELYKKQGKLDQAIELCKKVLDNNPDSLQCRYLMVQLLQEKGEESPALQEAIQILDKQIKKETAFHCTQCGFESIEPLWRCPQCGAWNTFLTQQK